jgi:hypothetical protein
MPEHRAIEPRIDAADPSYTSLVSRLFARGTRA